MGHTYRGPKSGCTMVTLFGGYSYDGVSAGVWVIHTEVPNLGARWSHFLAVTLMMAECSYMGHTYRGPKSGCKLVTLFGGYSNDGNSAIRVQHTEVPNQGARWSRFLAVTLMMV